MFAKLIRLGRNSELRFAPSGTAVCSFAGAYDVGYGDKKKTQWIDCVIFGKQAEKVNDYLKKGTQIVIYGDDLCIDTWDKDDGSKGFKLKCTVQNFNFAGGKPTESPNAQQAAPATQAADPLSKNIPFDDSAIPF